MADLPRRQLILYAAAAVAIALIGARYLQTQGPQESAAAGHQAAAGPKVSQPQGNPAVVHVGGAVKHPGVYKLTVGSRVNDAVAAAGGASRTGDINGLNLAAKLEDGRQVVVPTRAPTPMATKQTPGTAGGGAKTAAGLTAPVNLNSATVDQLDELEGVGPLTAEKIIEYREQHGGFSSIQELDKVPGIGEQRMKTLASTVTI